MRSRLLAALIFTFMTTLATFICLRSFWIADALLANLTSRMRVVRSSDTGLLVSRQPTRDDVPLRRRMGRSLHHRDDVTRIYDHPIHVPW